MDFTHSASEAIIQIMKKQGLDPDLTYLTIEETDRGCGIGFTKEPLGIKKRIHGLNIVVDDILEQQNFLVDFGEINGKRGLIFLSEKHQASLGSTS